MDELRAARLKRSYQNWRDRLTDSDLARDQLGDEVADAIDAGDRPAEVARVMGASRQQVQEVMRRRERRA